MPSTPPRKRPSSTRGSAPQPTASTSSRPLEELQGENASDSDEIGIYDGERETKRRRRDPAQSYTTHGNVGEEAADDDLTALFCDQNGSARKFFLHKSLTPTQHRTLRQLILDYGGAIEEARPQDNTTIIAKNELRGKIKDTYLLEKGVYVEAPSFINACIRAGKFEHTQVAFKHSGGRRVGAARTEFTLEDKKHIVEFLSVATPNVSDGGRMGKNIWKHLVELDEETYPWVKRHPWQGWREHYKKNREDFDARIKAAVRANPSPNNGVGRYRTRQRRPRVRPDSDGDQAEDSDTQPNPGVALRKEEEESDNEAEEIVPAPAASENNHPPTSSSSAPRPRSNPNPRTPIPEHSREEDDDTVNNQAGDPPSLKLELGHDNAQQGTQTYRRNIGAQRTQATFVNLTQDIRKAKSTFNDHPVSDQSHLANAFTRGGRAGATAGGIRREGPDSSQDDDSESDEEDEPTRIDERELSLSISQTHGSRPHSPAASAVAPVSSPNLSQNGPQPQMKQIHASTLSQSSSVRSQSVDSQRPVSPLWPRLQEKGKARLLHTTDEEEVSSLPDQMDEVELVLDEDDQAVEDELGAGVGGDSSIEEVIKLPKLHSEHGGGIAKSTYLPSRASTVALSVDDEQTRQQLLGGTPSTESKKSRYDRVLARARERRSTKRE